MQTEVEIKPGTMLVFAAAILALMAWLSMSVLTSFGLTLLVAGLLTGGAMFGALMRMDILGKE